MNFSNKFKICWWAGLLILLSVFLLWRVLCRSFNSFDIMLFMFWFILVLFPIISEISLFGLSIKREIESAKNEIRSLATEIKNQNNAQQIVNINQGSASKQEYDEKIREEVKEESIKTKENDSMKEGSSKKLSILSEEKARFGSQDRISKILKTEKLISEIFSTENDYIRQVKFEDITDPKKKIIFDGAIFEKEKIKELIEIKFITGKSFDRFYYIAGNFIRKAVSRIGLKIPIRLIVVSEEMNDIGAGSLKGQLEKLNFAYRNINGGVDQIKYSFYKFEEDRLNEIKI